MLKRIWIIPFVIISLACMWDNDTLEMETQQFPGTLDIITGNFLRHSPEFHHWRIRDRELKLLKFPDSLELYDDLAVSHSKLGQDRKAIQLMLTKDSLRPDLYETVANLGTFYIHAGDLETGKVYLEKALEINPNAHFGREIIQLELVNYILKRRQAGVNSLPLSSQTPHWMLRGGSEGFNFYHYLKAKNISPKEGLEGVLGMMRFGNFDSPVLLEVLGDLLLQNNPERDQVPRHLARFCYIKAGQESGNPESYQANIEAASEAIPDSRKFRNAAEESFQIALKTAREHYNLLRANEITWILSEEDPEELYKKNYYDQKKSDNQRLDFVDPRASEYRNLFHPDSSVASNKFIQLLSTQFEAKMREFEASTDNQEPEQLVTANPDENKKDDAWLYWVLGITGVFTILGIVLMLRKPAPKEND